jgi:FkbM family methyltransferase
MDDVNRFMGFHALYGNKIKRKAVQFLYYLLFGPLFQTNSFLGLITSCIIDPFKVRKLKIHGVKLVLNVSSYTSYRMINEFNRYQTEDKTQAWLQKNLIDGDIFMDVGGNIGAYIIYANKLRKLKSSVAIEASSINTKELLQNIYLNSLEDKDIKVIHAAAADENRLASFDIPNIRTGDGHGKVTSKIDDEIGGTFRKTYGDHSIKEIVNLRKLDDLFEELQLECPNVILMDIDAHEVIAMKGMTKMLSSETLRAVIVEVRETTHDDISKLLISHGFVCNDSSSGSVENLIYTRA